jgi:hypothetical protein
MKPPELYLADEIAYFPDASTKRGNGTYFVARPYVPYSLSLANRFKLAIGVFFGKYDVIYYKEDESKADGLIRREHEARVSARRNKKS